MVDNSAASNTVGIADEMVVAFVAVAVVIVFVVTVKVMWRRQQQRLV